MVSYFCDDELAKAVTMIQYMELPELSLTPAVVCDKSNGFLVYLNILLLIMISFC